MNDSLPSNASCGANSKPLVTGPLPDWDGILASIQLMRSLARTIDHRLGQMCDFPIRRHSEHHGELRWEIGTPENLVAEIQLELQGLDPNAEPTPGLTIALLRADGDNDFERVLKTRVRTAKGDDELAVVLAEFAVILDDGSK